MGSSNYRSSFDVKDGDDDDSETNNSKTSTNFVKGSTSLGFTSTNSYFSGSLPAQKSKMSSPLNSGNSRQLEEQQMRDLCERTWWKRVQRRRRSRARHWNKVEKHERSFAMCFSGSKKYGKGCNWFGNKRRHSNEELNYQDNMKCRTENQGVEAVSNGKRRVGRDAREYRRWLTPQAYKAKMSDTLGKRRRMPQGVGNVGRADSLADVEEVVAENCLSCSKKRQRLDFDSKQECCCCSVKPGHELHGTSVCKVVFEEACMARSPAHDDIVVSYIKDDTQVGKEDDGRESISRLSMELIEEDTSDAWGEESHLETKTDGEHNACTVCMLGGKLLCCEGKGCQRRYHLSCLDPPFNNAPPGVWHCIWCVKKKIALGVHSVSNEMESIWDVREVVSNQEEMRIQKEYLVKYHGLAHNYNQWIPGTKLLLEVPKLVAKFNKKSQVIKWKTEWTVPQRLLQKRLLSFGKHHDEYCQRQGESNSDCQYEWLVKWTGLGYEHATWELEDASFWTSPEAIKLMRDYEIRHAKSGRMSSLSKANELLEGKSNLPISSKLSFGGSPGAYNHYLSYVNKLYECWHKGQNAIVVDDQADQERVVKVILFVLSLGHTVRRPFLIISSSSSLSVWEAEFFHVAPSANLIVYKGNKDVRSSIRSLEFYNEGGQIMFQVLLSSSNIVIEDLEMLKCIDWKVIIIDECQRSCISKHFKEFKMLTADIKLLLVSTQIKDCSVDHLNMLSLLDSGLDGLDSGNVKACLHTNTNTLNEILAPYTAYVCKSGSFRFVEYWVPVQLSNVQLEQYCAMLLSKSMLLRSCLKNDPALREVIISIRKCCDHPYLLDQSLRSIVRKGLPIEEYLDAEIQVSGKLLLLDKILLEIKSQDLRALIIFQSIGGSGRDSIGDILEDFVRQRFGKDCYVRIDGGIYARSKKQAALKMFNDKESGKFIFLIENRACLPSIRLSSVDTVILFDSDWDPRNDLRTLQRITITSQFEQVKVFRLYSCCTVEEKVLILAKNGETLDNTIDSMNRNACHTLLNWGASHLFNKLDDFHGRKTFVSGSNIFSEQTFLDDVLCELASQFPCSSENNDTGTYSFISKVQQNGGSYSRNISLIGEKEMRLTDTEPPFFSWEELLEGRHPRWHYLSESSSRIRKKVQYVDNLTRKSEFENDDVKKKSCRLVNNQADSVDIISKLKRKRKLVVADMEHKPTDKKGDSNQKNDSPAIQPGDNSITGGLKAKMVESKKRNILPRRRKNTMSLLKLDITQLCDILKLPENVKDTTVAFLEHIMKVYHVSWKTDSTLQAFQISLCWTGASFSQHKIDHKESLVLAKLHLKFQCKEEEANYIFSRLQDAKKSFACHLENIKIVKESDGAKNSKLTTLDQKDLEEDEALMRLNCAKNFKSTASDQQDLEEGESLVGFRRRGHSDQLIDLDEGKIPKNSNHAKNSKSSSSQHDLEEGELPIGSHSQNCSDQLIDLEEGEIPINSNHAKNSKSTSSGQQDLKEKELLVGSQSQSCSDQMTDLEEGEIAISSDDAKNSKSTEFGQHDLEKREIPMGSPWKSFSDKSVDLEGEETAISNENKNPATIEQKPGFGMLDKNVEEKTDDSKCQMELDGENPNNSQLVSRIVEEEVAENPVTPLAGLCLSDSEFEVDKMSDNNVVEKTDDSNCQTELDGENPNNSQLVSRILEEEVAENHAKNSKSSSGQQDLEEGELRMGSQSQNHSDQLIGLEEGEIPINSNHAKNSKSTSSGQQDLKEEELPLGSQSQSCSDQLTDLEEGEIAICLDDAKNSKSTAFDQRDLEKREIPMGSPWKSLSDKSVDLEEEETAISNENQNPATIEQKPGFEMLDNDVEEKTDESNCQTELDGENPNNSQLVSRIVEEEVAKNPVTPLVGLCLSDSEFKVDKMLDNNVEEKTDDSHCQPELDGEIPNNSQLVSWIVEAEVAENPVTPLASLCLSDSEFNVDKMQPTDVSRVQVSSRNCIPKTMPSLSNQNHCGTVSIMLSEVTDISLNEKEFCSLPAGMVTIILDSDGESDGLEPIVTKNVSATCCKQSDEVSSSTHGLKGGVPALASLEKQSPVRNVQIVDSVMKPFETPQIQLHEVVMVDDPLESDTHAMPTQKESMALERADVSEVSQDSRVDTPVCVESPNLESTGTSSSLALQDGSTVQGNSFPLQQLPVSAVPSSTVHSLPGIPTVVETQCCQNGGRYDLSQEAQVSRQLLLEDPVDILNPSVMDLPLQPLTSMRVGVNETHFQDLRSRSNVQDFRSTDAVLEFLDDHLLHDGHVTAEISQPACSDPLQIEIERIQKDDAQDLKTHAEMILHIKSERDKEIEGVFKKYDMLLKDAEAALVQKRNDRKTVLQKVHANKVLAQALTWKHSNYWEANSPATSGHMNPSIQPATQQTAQMPGSMPEQCLVSPPVASSVGVINHSSAVLPTIHVRPYSSPPIFFPRNFQSRSELRFPAPHLQAYRSDSSVLPPSFLHLYDGVSNQQFPCGSSITSMMQTRPAQRQFTGSCNIRLPESGGSL